MSAASNRPLLIGLGRGHEFVVEAEPVEKAPQHGVVVRGETLVLAERIGDPGQGLAEMGGDELAVGDIVRSLPQAIHVVGEGDEPGPDRVARQHAKRMPHHGRPRDFAEGADMRQPRGAVAGLENHFGLGGVLEPRDQLSRFLERPGFGDLGGLAQRGQDLILLGRPAVGSGRRQSGHYSEMRGGESIGIAWAAKNPAANLGGLRFVRIQRGLLSRSVSSPLHGQPPKVHCRHAGASGRVARAQRALRRATPRQCSSAPSTRLSAAGAR